MDSRQRAHAGGFFQDLFGTIGMIQLPFFFYRKILTMNKDMERIQKQSPSAASYLGR